MQNTKLGKKGQVALLTGLSFLVTGLLILLAVHFKIPNPNMVLMIALVFFTGIGGLLPGLVSAMMMIAYTLYFFSENGSFFTFSQQQSDQILTAVPCILFCYATVLLLKRSRDSFHNRYLKQNRLLEAEAENARRIESLSSSVSSLLINMPAMTFSKDINTGKYLACNQFFAEYARKDTPEGVIGLTDHEIFDKATADHFTEDDRRAMGMDKPYVFYENVPDAAGEMRHLQTTKLKFFDSEGRERLLGMTVDITELYDMKMETQRAKEAYEEARDESMTYSRIAQALSADYSSLFYVDLETERYITYRSDAETGTLSVRQVSGSFFEEMRQRSAKLVYAPDLENFNQNFTRENVIASIEDNGVHLFHFRMLRGDEPVYVSLKATRLIGDPTHLVVGISDIDSDMKQQAAAERLREQRTAFKRIAALSGDYISFYSVDPETEAFQQFNATRDFISLGLTSEGNNFFAQAAIDAEKAVYPEDLAYFRSRFTRENVMKTIAEKQIFVLRYRMVLDGSPFFVNVKAALVDEADGRKLIVGTNSIDEQVRQEEEYRFNLAEAREKANRDGLTGVKNKMAYNEAIEAMEKRIGAGETPVFALVVCDVNNLKKTNDTHGHLAGDQLLKEACRIICDSFQHSPVFRIGGDEFAVIVQGRDYENLDSLVARIHQVDEAHMLAGGAVIACGAARYNGRQSLMELFEEADNDMYRHKTLLKA